jgi:hypothetical protein
MPERVRVMLLAANPFLDLKINDEVRDIRARIRESVLRAVDLTYEPAVRTGDLIGRLDESKPHIVHFSGHGTQEHELILLDERDSPATVSRELLAELFRLCRDNLRVVFLNFCHSLPIAEELCGVVDVVIGTTGPIRDEAARFFAAQFYGSLSSGVTVLDAFDRAMLQLKLKKIAGGEVLRLLHADGVAPDQLRLVEPSVVAPGSPEGEGSGGHIEDHEKLPQRGPKGRGPDGARSGAPGAFWRWAESNSDLLSVALIAAAIVTVTAATAGMSPLGIGIEASAALAGAGWLAYRIAARRREDRALVAVARSNVVNRPGYFRVRPYDDSEDDQQLFDRADGPRGGLPLGPRRRRAIPLPLGALRHGQELAALRLRIAPAPPRARGRTHAGAPRLGRGPAAVAAAGRRRPAQLRRSDRVARRRSG